MLLQSYRDLHETMYWTSVVLHESEGRRKGDCLIKFLWFEDREEVYAVAMGMDIKPHPHVIHEGGKQADAENKKKMMMENGNGRHFFSPQFCYIHSKDKEWGKCTLKGHYIVQFSFV